MAYQYYWFQFDKDKKFENNNFALQDITEPKLIHLFGLFLFDLKNKAELDVVPDRLEDIKNLTIGQHHLPEGQSVPESVWSNDHMGKLLEKIENARRSLLENDLDNVVPKYTGDKHKITISGEEEFLLDALYLDADPKGKSWNVEDIVDEAQHEDFYQPIFRQKDPNLKSKQLRVLHTDLKEQDEVAWKNAVKLEPKDWQKAYKATNPDSKITSGKNKLTIKFDINFMDLNIHQKKLRTIFPGQKIIFTPESLKLKSPTGYGIPTDFKPLKVKTGDYKRELAKTPSGAKTAALNILTKKEFILDALEDAVELSGNEEELKQVLEALSEFKTKPEDFEPVDELKTSRSETPSGKSKITIQGIPFDAEDYVDKLGIEIQDEGGIKILWKTIEEASEDSRFKAVLKQNNKDWVKAKKSLKRLKKDHFDKWQKKKKMKKKRLTITLTGTSKSSALNLFYLADEKKTRELKESTTQWLDGLNETDVLYNYFAKSLLPMSLNSLGNYSFTIILKKKDNNIAGTIKWEYNQLQELNTKFLSLPAGQMKRVKFNFGKKREKAKWLHAEGLESDPNLKNERKQKALGFNPVRQYLAKYTTRRLKELDNAIKTLKGDDE